MSVDWKAVSRGGIVPVSREDYEYFLDALPPAFMHRRVQLMNGDFVAADYGFVEGDDRVTAFFRKDDGYFAAGTTLFRGGRP